MNKVNFVTLLILNLVPYNAHKRSVLLTFEDFIKNDPKLFTAEVGMPKDFY